MVTQWHKSHSQTFHIFFPDFQHCSLLYFEVNQPFGMKDIDNTGTGRTESVSDLLLPRRLEFITLSLRY